MERGGLWQYTGQVRPPFADEPAPGQVSVWDFPRPPRLVTSGREIRVAVGATTLAHTRAALCVQETAAPPTWYIPPHDLAAHSLVRTRGQSGCEWKGVAVYWALADDENGAAVAWSYPEPHPAYRALRDYVGFYPARVACYLDGERVLPQPGTFYGGWLSSDLAGPFKGEPGTEHW